MRRGGGEEGKGRVLDFTHWDHKCSLATYDGKSRIITVHKVQCYNT